MLDHMSLPVSDYAKSKQFYSDVLPSIGGKFVMEPVPNVCGFGRSMDAPTFWIAPSDKPDMARVHVAFTCETPEQVDAFHKAALAHGAKDEGAPGPRPHYHPGYYGAFVVDRDNHNVEAVCHTYSAKA